MAGWWRCRPGVLGGRDVVVLAPGLLEFDCILRILGEMDGNLIEIYGDSMAIYRDVGDLMTGLDGLGQFVMVSLLLVVLALTEK